MLPTLVLAVSRKQISLYLYRYDSIEEIKDDHFPFVYTEEYEYAKPSRGTSFGGSLKGFEKDKSVMQKNRFEHFLGGRQGSVDIPCRSQQTIPVGRYG